MNRKYVLFLVLFIFLAAYPVPGSAEESQEIDVKMLELPNGLRVYVHERHASPTFVGYYQFQVGGAKDPDGRSGIAHLLEHMMFKGATNTGTTDYEAERPLLDKLDVLWDELHEELDARENPFREANEQRIEELESEIAEVSAKAKEFIVKNEYDELMTRAGGVGMNASTGNDRTNYFIQLPSNQLELWFRMESNRLLKPVFREFFSERDVVFEERRMRTENSASGLAGEAMDGLLYSAHPYGKPVVGWPSDLYRLHRRDAMNYFRTYYSPNNCIMVLVGDFEAEQVFEYAKKYFSAWQRQEIPSLRMTDEPEQKGERRAVVEFDAEPTIRVGYPTVREGHDDAAALDVLSRIIGGGRSSKLQVKLVQEERIASSAGAYHPTQDQAGYFMFYGTPRAPHTVDEIQAAFDEVIADLQENEVTARDLEAAKVRTEISRVRQLDSNFGLVFRIANSAVYSGDMSWASEYENRVNAVTAADVMRVAKEYLKKNRKNVVTVATVEGAGGGRRRSQAYEHGRGGFRGERGAVHSVAFEEELRRVLEAPDVELKIPMVGKEVDRVVLKSGITLFIMESHEVPAVSLGFSFLGGSNTTPVEELAPFEVASSLLSQGGTESLDPKAFQEKLAELGMSFSAGFGSTQAYGYFWSLKRNLNETMDLMTEAIRKPRLDSERLEVVKGQYIERMRRRKDSPRSARAYLSNHIRYGDHPRLGYIPSKEEIESITVEQVRALCDEFMGPNNLYITAVGDFDKDEMIKMIEDRFGDWRKSKAPKRTWIKRDPVIKPGVFILEKDLPQCALTISLQMDVDREAPRGDHWAITMLNDVLGGSGFRSRLMERLRSDEGLTYGIYSSFSHEGRKGVPGGLSISWDTKAESAVYSCQSVMEELNKIIGELVSEPELQEQIEAWENSFIFRFTDDSYNVSRLLDHELDDRPYDWDAEQLDGIRKVTREDVLEVAKKYIDPSKVSVFIVGALSEEDREGLKKLFGNVTIVPEDEVFTGGY